MSNSFLQNCWYVAAWGNELAPGEHMRRVLLDKPVLLMRARSGQAAAIGNVCPHRFASLSEGLFEEDAVECPYHGLRFNMRGQCVHNPHGDGMIPERASVPSFRVVERHGAIWIWLGDSEKADPDLIPDFSFLDADGRASGYLATKANYQLLSDNIMDLSHADFVHRTTLGTGGDMARAVARARLDGDVVIIEWSFDGKGLLINRKTPDAPDEHTNIQVTWYAPGAMIIRSEFYPIGDETSKRTRSAAHIMTPESNHSTHYFFNISDASRIEQARRVFETEDGVMLEEVERNMGGRGFWDLNPVILSNDRAAVLTRRVLQRRIQREQNHAAAADQTAEAEELVVQGA